MTKPLVVAVHADGAIEYTRNSALNNFFEGRGDMVRVTDIQKERDGNRYYIKWLAGPCAGLDHTYGMSIAAGVISTCPAVELIMTFPTYEAAVSHEVEVLDALRRKGVRFRD